MEVTIKQGDLQVLTTNSIIVPKGLTTTIKIEDFEIDIVFIEGNKQEIRTNVIGNKGIKISLVSFNNALGTSTTNPIAIAQREGKTVFISLSAYAINDVRILTYTILSEV